MTDDLQQIGPLNRVAPVRAAKLPKPSTVVRFLRKVRIRPDGCWIWAGGCNTVGYGYFRHPATKYAHRASYLLLVGPIPEGCELDHLCGVKSCVNPDHLEPVSARVNVRRAHGETWTACDRLHPTTPTRLAPKREGGSARMRCLECHRVTETAARKQREAHYRQLREAARSGE